MSTTKKINEFNAIKKMFGKGKLPQFYKWSKQPDLAPLVKLMRLPAVKINGRPMDEEDLLSPDIPTFLNKSVKTKESDERYLSAFKERMDKVKYLIDGLNQIAKEDPKMPSVKFIKQHMSGIRSALKKRLGIYEDMYAKMVSGPERSTPSVSSNDADDSKKRMTKGERERYMKDLDASASDSEKADRKAARSRDKDRRLNQSYGTMVRRESSLTESTIKKTINTLKERNTVKENFSKMDALQGSNAMEKAFAAVDLNTLMSIALPYLNDDEKEILKDEMLKIVMVIPDAELEEIYNTVVARAKGQVTEEGTVVIGKI
jgi:hypothetical protein